MYQSFCVISFVFAKAELNGLALKLVKKLKMYALRLKKDMNYIFLRLEQMLIIFIFSYNLLISSDEAVILQVPQGINSTSLVGKRIFATGSYNQK